MVVSYDCSVQRHWTIFPLITWIQFHFITCINSSTSVDLYVPAHPRPTHSPACHAHVFSAGTRPSPVITLNTLIWRTQRSLINEALKTAFKDPSCGASRVLHEYDCLTVWQQVSEKRLMNEFQASGPRYTNCQRENFLHKKTGRKLLKSVQARERSKF